MPEPLLASPSDLAARMGDVGDLEQAVAALEDASSLIHLVSGRVWIDDEGALVDTVPGVVKTICCAVARRVLTNPEGLSAESVVNYSATYTNASTDVYLTKSEVKRLRQAAGLGGVTVISSTRGRMETPRVRLYDRDVVWIDEFE